MAESCKQDVKGRNSSQQGSLECQISQCRLKALWSKDNPEGQPEERCQLGSFVYDYAAVQKGKVSAHQSFSIASNCVVNTIKIKVHHFLQGLCYEVNKCLIKPDDSQ